MTSSHAHCETALADAGVVTPASECHGLACGVYCVRRTAEPDEWVEAVVAGAAGDEDDLRPAVTAIEEAVAESIAALAGAEFEFAPLLSPDHEPLPRRIRDLASWCTGFLGGLGLAGLDPSRLGPESAEFLADLREMAMAVPDGRTSDVSETHYAELVEYLRVGVMHVEADLDHEGG